MAGKRVWVAGHQGMLGSALVRRLQLESCEILIAERGTLDLRRQQEVEVWLAENRPDVVFCAAARVGGILTNGTLPAQFLYDNLAIDLNIVEACRRLGVAKLLLLESVCTYPKMAPQPVREDALLTGPLEPANQWYAIAKIASIKLAQAYRRQYGCDFISATPANLYGPGDNFDLATGHVLPSLIRKTHEAMLAGMPTMQIWGSGRARREFLHVDDCADALIFLMQGYSGESQVNIGTGADISILELAQLVANIVGFKGSIVTDPSMPDGTPARLLSSDLMHGLGWNCSIPLEAGIAATYRWYLDNAGTARGLHRHQE